MIVPKFQRKYEWKKMGESDSPIDDDCIISGEERLNAIRDE